MNENEMAERIYDKLFDNIGMSEHHVDIGYNANIIDSWSYKNEIGIDVEMNGVIYTFEIAVKDVSHYECNKIKNN
jgi:hypothetical protein